MTKYYLKDGRTVGQYCKEVDDRPPYSTIMYRLTVLGWNPDDAVSKPSIHNDVVVHGMSFKKYCEEHGLNYVSTHVAWKRLTQNNKRYRKEDITAEQFVDNLLNGVKYEWDLSKIFDNHYCESKGLNYRSLYTYWNNYKRYEMTFKEYVDYRYNTKGADLIDGLRPKKYCDDRGYSYHMLYSRYRRARGYKTFKDYLIKWEKENGYRCETS